jgi:hypothetical protein
MNVCVCAKSQPLNFQNQANQLIEQIKSTLVIDILNPPRSHIENKMIQMIAVFVTTVAAAYLLYQYQHQYTGSNTVPIGERVAGTVTEGMMKMMPEPTAVDSSKGLNEAKKALERNIEEDGLQQLKTLVESWQHITGELEKQQDDYKGSNCELLDIKLASMIAIDHRQEKHMSVLIDSLPEGFRDIVVDMVAHLEAQPGVSPAKILARHAARTFHARKIPGIANWSDESICKLIYWEIIAAEKYIKWRDWLTFRRPKKQ